jgi:hypothetical protein
MKTEDSIVSFSKSASEWSNTQFQNNQDHYVLLSGLGLLMTSSLGIYCHVYGVRVTKIAGSGSDDWIS